MRHWVSSVFPQRLSTFCSTAFRAPNSTCTCGLPPDPSVCGLTRLVLCACVKHLANLIDCCWRLYQNGRRTAVKHWHTQAYYESLVDMITFSRALRWQLSFRVITCYACAKIYSNVVWHECCHSKTTQFLMAMVTQLTPMESHLSLRCSVI